MGAIRQTREKRGMTLAQLATRLGSTASAVHQLEKSEDLGTIKLSSLRSALGALGAELELSTRALSPLEELTPARVAEQISKMLRRKDSTGSILRYLTFAVDEARLNSEDIPAIEWAREPRPIDDERWDSLLKAMYREATSPGSRQPWMQPRPLNSAWFVNELPITQNRARTSTPAYLADLNIFVDRSSLVRA